MEQETPQQATQTKQERKERKELKHRQKLQDKEHFAKMRLLKRVAKITLITLLIVGGLGGFIWYLATRPPISEGEIISKNGLHWHPELAIYLKGVKQKIPANIGIGVVHQPLHTHDASGVIHIEMQGVIRRDDIKLGRFFKIWGKDFMEFGSSVSMTVNGEANAELENYQMKDGDKIELKYE